jgi:hypothetical protein
MGRFRILHAEDYRRRKMWGVRAGGLLQVEHPDSLGAMMNQGAEAPGKDRKKRSITAREMARRSLLVRMTKLTPEQRSAIGRNAVEVRWARERARRARQQVFG